MKQTTVILALVLLLSACSAPTATADLAATTLPVYEFTQLLCRDTGLTVGRVITEDISCVHNYTLQPSQMKLLENAKAIIVSGIEDFMADAFPQNSFIIDASVGIDEHDHHEQHHHDAHIWLSPINAKVMATNICAGLSDLYPHHKALFQQNLADLHARLDALLSYGENQLQDLSCRELITFHDGFSCMAEAFDLNILQAVEEESGSEASAAELISIIRLIEIHRLPAIFTEVNGSSAAADIISSETGVSVYALDMALSGESYLDAMYRNIDTLQEALQ